VAQLFGCCLNVLPLRPSENGHIENGGIEIAAAANLNGEEIQLFTWSQVCPHFFSKAAMAYHKLLRVLMKYIVVIKIYQI
jgi:hypothetical protein